MLPQRRFWLFVGMQIEFGPLIHRIVRLVGVYWGIDWRNAGCFCLERTESDHRKRKMTGRWIARVTVRSWKRITLSQAIIFCWVTGIAGIVLLSLTVPFVAVFLSGLSLALYVFVYTPMKQTSNIAVMIGAIPGALPPLIGYTAVVGRIDEPGMMLFLVQFFWQFPHFWSIAWMLHDDYQKAGYWMLPSSGGRDKKSAYQILIYTVLLIIISMTPVYYGMCSVRALIVILPISLWVLSKAFALFRSLEIADARKLLYSTLIYTPVVFLGYIFFKRWQTVPRRK